MKILQGTLIAALASVAFALKSHRDIPAVYSRGPIDDVTYYSCHGKPDGDYIHPFDCTRFIKCHNWRAADFPCPDCGKDNNPSLCQGNEFLVFNLTMDWCDWPANTDCVTDGTPAPPETTTTEKVTTTTSKPNTTTTTTTQEPDTTTTTTTVAPDPHPCQGRTNGSECDPNDIRDCEQCGICIGRGQFIYFHCVANERSDPRHKITGYWQQESCSSGDFFNPDAEGGQCTGNWDDLSDEVKEEYRSNTDCYPHIPRCPPTGEGHICHDVQDGDSCDPNVHCDDCGRCDGDGRFSFFNCTGHAPEDPRDPWIWTWKQWHCAEGEFFNPTGGVGHCSSDWSAVPEDLKPSYRDCFQGPPDCPQNQTGTICPETQEGEACHLDGTCSCGRCDGNGEFSYFTCEPSQHSDPREGWYGNWTQTRCQNESVYDPAQHACEPVWENVVEWARKTYESDEKCFPVDICEEWEDAPCSNKYHAKEPGQEAEVRYCPANRYFSHQHKNCRACEDVLNEDGSRCALDNGTCAVAGRHRL